MTCRYRPGPGKKLVPTHPGSGCPFTTLDAQASAACAAVVGTGVGIGVGATVGAGVGDTVGIGTGVMIGLGLGIGAQSTETPPETGETTTFKQVMTSARTTS
jgi:hypothetical protein